MFMFDVSSWLQQQKGIIGLRILDIIIYADFILIIK